MMPYIPMTSKYMDSDAGLKEVYVCTKSINHFHIFNLYILQGVQRPGKPGNVGEF